MAAVRSRWKVSKGISHLWHWTQTALRCESKDLAAARGLALDPAEIPSPRAHVKRAGYVSNNGNESFFLVPPYGRCRSQALAEAASWSEEFGHGEIRLSPFRALVIPFVEATREAHLARLASGFGYIVNENDPRLAVSTCAGMAGCSRGST